MPRTVREFHIVWRVVTLLCQTRVVGVVNQSRLLHDDLHWLDVPQRVQYKLAVMVHRCLGRRAPPYLADYCVPVSTVPGRQHLRSASRRQLTVPRVRRSTFGARAFAIAGPTVWNSLPDDSLRDPAVGPDQFRRDLKTHLFE